MIVMRISHGSQSICNRRSELASPLLGVPMETFASPVDDKPISTWKARDDDMKAAGCVDARDFKSHKWRNERVRHEHGN